MSGNSLREATLARMQATSKVSLNDFWCGLQNNNNNAYNFSLASGNFSNNNKNNQYWSVPIDSEDLTDIVFKAEEDCWKNKHSSCDASRVHYKARVLWSLISSLGYGEYKPTTSVCFIVNYPKPREVFAAMYIDRIVHHIVCIYMRSIAEKIHSSIGDKSFGNRCGKSAFHAAKRAQELMKKFEGGYVGSLDISSFFMSTDKVVALRVWEDYESKFYSKDINPAYRKFVLSLIRQITMHDPTTNCRRTCDPDRWNLIPNSKSLFYNNGLPIGNYYSQLLEIIQLAVVCERLDNMVSFVDDFLFVVRSAIDFQHSKCIFNDTLTELHLKNNEHKIYLQPVRNGIKWCGYVIRPDRIYLANRTIKNCLCKIENKRLSLSGARELLSTVNAYLGMMRHCTEYNTQKHIIKIVLKRGFGKWLYFKKREGGFICVLKKKFTPRFESMNDIMEVDDYYKKMFNK